MNALRPAGISVFKTIRFRLTVGYLLGIALLVALFGGVAYSLLSRDLYRNLDESLRTRTSELESSVRYEGGEFIFEQKFNDLILIYDANGALAHRLGPNVRFDNIEELVQQALFGRSGYSTATTTEGLEVRLYATPFNLDSRTRIAIVAGRLTHEIHEILAIFRVIIIGAALAVTVLAGVGGTLLTGRALKQVDHITDIAREIGEGDLSLRIDVRTQDELGRLAATLNGMIGRLEDAFRRQKRFAADASHELRTPLAIIKAESSLALDKSRTQADYRKSLELVSQEVSYMGEIIDNLLQLARADSGDEASDFREVNLRDLLTELSLDIAALAEEKGLAFAFGPLDDLVVRGDRLKLRQLFLNILENAVRYTPSGGTVSGSLARRDGSALVTVSDTGPGIPAEHLPHVFDRFYRVDGSRAREDGGTGLGLAIAWSIAKLHGGEIRVESEVGKGSAFFISLPLLESPEA